MKLFMLIFTVFSMCFANPWIAFDLKYNVDIEDFGDDDADDGAITIGYEFPMNKDLNFGFGYDIKGSKFDGDDDHATLLNLYSKYYFSSESDMSFWGTLGYSIPTGDIDDYDSGLSYGFGMTHNNGFGIYYIINDLGYSDSYYDGWDYYDIDVDITVTRLGISWTFKNK